MATISTQLDLTRLMTDTTSPMATQADPAGAANLVANANSPRKPPRQGARGRQPAAQPARSPRAVHPVLQQLFGLYPALFGGHFLPLKLGVFQDLLALHSDQFKKEDLKVALGLHARSTRYLEGVASGLQRHDLNGVAVEPVAPEHVHHAIMEVFKRRQARSGQDLRPFVRVQLIQAIDASGLSREDYLLCIRQQDEISQGLLDDAFAELAAQAAKRDALLRTFTASGKTVAEFADMYGMHPQEVTGMLDRARLSLASQAAHAANAAEVDGATLSNAVTQQPLEAGAQP